jgi:hypothetical protein
MDFHMRFPNDEFNYRRRRVLISGNRHETMTLAGAPCLNQDGRKSAFNTIFFFAAACSNAAQRWKMTLQRRA